MNSAVANYSKKELKCNKLKKKLLILAIVLSTFLITTVGILFTSLRESLMLDTKEKNGFHHGIFLNVTDEKLEVLTKHNMIKDLGKVYDIERIKYSESKNKMLNLSYVEKGGRDFFGIEVKEGTFSEGSEEVVISKNLSNEISKDIGDYIELNKKQFKIKGIIEAKKSPYINGNTILVSEAYFNQLKENLKQSNVFFTLKKDKDLNKDIALIGMDLGIEEKNTVYNMNLIEKTKYKMEDILPFIVVAILVLISAIISIYNIFNISVKERVQQFGLLAALGASEKHIKSIIRREGFILCIKGIPLGLILSFLVSLIVIPNLPINTKVIMEVSPITIIISVLVVLIAVYISLIRPSRNASKISPLAAINYNDAESKNKKTKKGNKVLNLSKLARINLGRNKKRAIVTIMSLSMSFILFLVVATVLYSMNLENLIKTMVISDYQISLNYRSNVTDTENLLLDNKEVAEIKAFKGVEEVYTIKSKFLNIKNFQEPSMIFGYNKELLNSCKKNVVSGEFNLEKMKNEKGVLLVASKEEKMELPKVGDKVILKYNCKVDGNDAQIKEEEFKVQAIVDKNAWKAGVKAKGPSIITSEDVFIKSFGQIENTRIGIKVNNDSKEEFEHYLNKYNDEKGLEVTSFNGEFKKIKNQKKGIEVIAYSAVCVICIIGIFNMINTTITNIISRKKELGILEATGLTDKQINNLLIKEGLYYLGISFSISILVGLPLSYELYLLFKKEATYAQYQFPLIQIIIMMFIMIIIQMICVKIVQFKGRKTSIIDKIKLN